MNEFLSALMPVHDALLDWAANGLLHTAWWQVAAGGYVDNSAVALESFDGVSVATARFASIAADHHPMIVSAPDGKFLVIFLREPEMRQRSVRH